MKFVTTLVDDFFCVTTHVYHYSALLFVFLNCSCTDAISNEAMQQRRIKVQENGPMRKLPRLLGPRARRARNLCSMRS
jgi:hypothetical protein